MNFATSFADIFLLTRIVIFEESTPLNAPLATLIAFVMFSLITRSFVAPLNAFFPIALMVFGSVRAVMFLQFLNAFALTAVTLYFSPYTLTVEPMTTFLLLLEIDTTLTVPSAR